MSVNHLVHCHLCPLKDFCTIGCPDASWRIQHQGFSVTREDRQVRVTVHDNDYEDMTKSSLNCPLRRAVAFADTALSQELLKRLK
jgi:hypothetical protein